MTHCATYGGKNCLQDFARREGYTGNGVKFNGFKDYFGFDITYSGTRVLWIRCFKNEDAKPENDFIVVTSYANERKLQNQLKKKIGEKQFEQVDYNGDLVYAKIAISDILAKNTFEEQKEVFDNWIKENFITDVLAKSWDIISKDK